MEIEFEELTHQNFSDACQIDRDDIPEDYVDTASTIMNITDYGLIHHCIGHSFVVKYHERSIGVILLGEWQFPGRQTRQKCAGNQFIV